MPEAMGEDKGSHGLCTNLTCSPCAFTKALRKLSEADILRNSLKSKANVISRFEDATFFSLKGEVKARSGGIS